MKRTHGHVGVRRAGFTLLELSISVALMVVVTLLGFIASSSSAKSADLTRRMTTLQEELRSTMRALSDQVQPAVKAPRTGMLLPQGATQALRIVSTSTPTSITFVVPTNAAGTAYSGVNTIRFESEDKPATGVVNGQFGNGQLDSGEDTNADGRLNRQLVLIRPDGTRVVLGGSSHLANVAFTLSPDGSMLGVTMTASMRLEQSKTRMFLNTLTSNIYIMN